MYAFITSIFCSIFCSYNYHLFAIPESVEDHSEEDEFTKKRYHERRRRDDLGQQEEEHSQWQ